MSARALPPLVLLHGLGTGPAGWRPQAEALGAEREIVVPGLPPSLAASTAAVVALLDARPAADLCGLSLGGLVALRAALERPGRVRRLVLSAAFARLPPRLRVLQLTLAALVRVLPGPLARRGLLSAVPESHRAEAGRELRLSGRELSRVMREGARHDVAAAAARLHVPTLVLCGERDRPNHALSRELAALLPDATFALVPGAGHVANLDRPDAFTAALRAFLG